ncbi:MAG: hypothetical protein FWD42_04820 [Solirubrobacterales bacterium]|nr:hypothetical protein [Solirubrobacterales bacterium]
MVLGLARGGVPVAHEVARELGAPLDVLVVCKIGAPGNPELGLGAIAEGGVRVLGVEVLRALLVTPEEIDDGVRAAAREVQERVRRYRGEGAPLALQGRTAVIVDDGLATGGTAVAAARAARERGARRVVVAVPVGAPTTVATVRGEADEVVCLLEPDPMWAIGLWYENFAQVSDEEVAQLLAGGRAGEGEEPAAGGEQRPRG